MHVPQRLRMFLEGVAWHLIGGALLFPAAAVLLFGYGGFGAEAGGYERAMGPLAAIQLWVWWLPAVMGVAIVCWFGLVRARRIEKQAE